MIRRGFDVRGTAALALIGLMSPVAAGGDAAFIPIGDLAGGATNSWACNVSPDGAAVTGMAVDATGAQIFRWTEATGLVALTSVDGAFACGIGGNGAVVAGSAPGADGLDMVAWSAVSGLVTIAKPAGATGDVWVADCSHDGTVIAGDASPAGGVREPVRWNNGVFEWLGTLPGAATGFGSSTGGVSGDGNVIVGGMDSTDGYQAYRWTAPADLIGLGDLPGGDFLSQAFSATEDGAMVVGYGTTDVGWEAFRWTARDGMVALGALDGGSGQSVANDVSADGSVVVGAANHDVSGFAVDAYIWTPFAGARKLQDVLVEQGLGDDLVGWHLQSAVAISSDGCTIVGFGLDPAGDSVAYLARLERCPADLNGDGSVDVGDMLMLLGAWGGC